MKNSSEIIDWDNLQSHSEKFKKNKPFKFGYIENFFVKSFYEKLRQSYPKIDDTWKINNAVAGYKYDRVYRHNPKSKELEIVGYENDSLISNEWKSLLQYISTKEFIENFQKFSGLNISNCLYAGFSAYKKGGFHIPHIHNNGPNCLIMLFYFNKNWPKGEGGGTYVATEEDESTLIFEPSNLDNTMMVFEDGPKSAHGVRYITKDIVRQGFQLELQNYSPEKGWSGVHGYENFMSELKDKKKNR